MDEAANAADKIAAMLVNAIPEDVIRQTAIDKLGVSAKRWPKLLADCRRKLTLAASYNRDEELARSITRLNGIYANSAAIQDAKTCLQAVRELNKLMGLYHAPPPPGDGPDGAASRSEAQARAHLEKLIPGGDKLPLHELARLAAQRAINA
jgi:hypothetical protein